MLIKNAQIIYASCKRWSQLLSEHKFFLPSSPPFGDILKLSDYSFEFSLFMITSSILPPSFPFGDILKLSDYSFEFSFFIACWHSLGEAAGEGRVDPPVALHFHQIFPGDNDGDDDQ